MKKTILSVVAFALSVQFCFSQIADHFDSGSFEKRVEYNTNGGALIYNVRSKPALDKVLFGWTNSMVEYVYDCAFEEVIALRVIKDSLTYKLEVFRLPDSNKIKNWLYWEADLRAVPNLAPDDSLMTFSEFKQLMKKRNEEIGTKNYFLKLHEKYGPEPKSFEISEQFAAKLHDKMSVLIRDFKAIRVRDYPPNRIVAIADGDHATFRCVVGDELWTLNIHIPEKRAKQLSEVCNKIITDAEKGKKLNEAKYIKLLDGIDL